MLIAIRVLAQKIFFFPGMSHGQAAFCKIFSPIVLALVFSSSSNTAMQVVGITVEFSDELLLETSGVHGALPTLSLSNGGAAAIVGGTGTREWLFSYDFTGEDNGTDMSVLHIANDSVTAINCTEGCRASNWNGAKANLSVRLTGELCPLLFPTKTVSKPRSSVHCGYSWQSTTIGQGNVSHV